MRLLALALATSAAAVNAVGLPQIVAFDDNGLDFTSLPIILDSSDSPAVHIAAESFGKDLNSVSGKWNGRFNDTIPSEARQAIIVGTAQSPLIRRIQDHSRKQNEQATYSSESSLLGQWEAFNIRVVRNPSAGLDEALVITGSDKRGVIFGLYTLSEQIGVSPWVWWADVPPTPRHTLSFPRSASIAHGSPTVKYRGIFINDEQPVLWNWAKETFHTGSCPPFQVGMYEKLVELVLRLKGNYLWPAMWESMFAVDGLQTLPDQPTPGPNQLLADRMGIVMGTSHHEPMSRNQREWTNFGNGSWSFVENSDRLESFWEYGAERAKELDTLYTVGMRGDGDMALGEANIPLLENITAVQQNILRKALGKDNLTAVPQTWAMYKEVMGFFADGLRVPSDVTPLLADDNWGNLMAVMPDESHPAGGGIYYHVDYVGDPRDYKWISTASLPKMWEQLNIAHSLNTQQIWILNVGDLKFQEVSTEYFMSLAYDFERWTHDSLLDYLVGISSRDFGTQANSSHEIAEILATYSMLASRRKAELVDSATFSLVNYEENIRVLSDWTDLRDRAQVVHNSLDQSKQLSFWQLILLPIQLQLNHNDLYISAAKSNLYATQGRTAANLHADHARSCLEADADYIDAFDSVLDGKWKNTLAQPHFNYQYWQSPARESLPPISYVSTRRPTYSGNAVHIRYIPENSLGAWPGDGKYNCGPGHSCPDPVLLPVDKFGRTRWVDVASGGPLDVDFEVHSNVSWLTPSPSSGHITGDGKSDTRVYLQVDWEAVAQLDHLPTGAKATFKSSDGARTVVTIPIRHVQGPPADFHGAIEGDRYLAVEALHHQSSTSGRFNVSWAHLPYYGRTLSALTPLPVVRNSSDIGVGPSMTYDLWFTTTPVNGTLNITFHLGPSLNFILGDRLAFAVSLDGGEQVLVQPVPNVELGKLPADWEQTVASEVREVSVSLPVARPEAGAHRVTVWGVTSGIVIQRMLIDFGGISERGYSYLGPPESILA